MDPRFQDYDDPIFLCNNPCLTFDARLLLDTDGDFYLEMLGELNGSKVMI